MPVRSLPSCLILVLLLAAEAASAAATAEADARIVAQARQVADGGRIALYAHGEAQPDVALLDAAQHALTTMEALLGRRLDHETLGPRVRLYVSTEVGASHVWHGYAHPADPQGALFLNPKIARLGVAGRNATYAHELAHLLTWRFHSHTLREGLADWLALQVHPDAAVGPNADPQAALPEVPDAVRQLLGTQAPPPAGLADDAAFRAAYYAGSRRFVAFLIERGGLQTFMALYEHADPEAAFAQLYGTSRAALVQQAFAS